MIFNLSENLRTEYPCMLVDVLYTLSFNSVHI